MPYIDPRDRPRVRKYVEALAFGTEPASCDMPKTCGELNFAVSLLAYHRGGIPLIEQAALDYLAHKGRSYQTFNDIGGAILFAAFERERRAWNSDLSEADALRILHSLYSARIAAYENVKIASNGDLFE